MKLGDQEMVQNNVDWNRFFLILFNEKIVEICEIGGIRGCIMYCYIWFLHSVSSQCGRLC